MDVKRREQKKDPEGHGETKKKEGMTQTGKQNFLSFSLAVCALCVQLLFAIRGQCDGRRETRVFYLLEYRLASVPVLSKR